MESSKHMVKKNGLFFWRWLQSPKTVGAVVPSSEALAAAMARAVPLADGYVIELGGGTGVITQALLNRGVDPKKLIVIERDPTFYNLLIKRFPNLVIINGNATDLTKLVAAAAAIRQASAIVSGLPLIGMPKPVQHKIMDECKALMGTQSPFVQFTYSLFSPLNRQEFSLTGQRLERIFNNIPPASVWQYYKK